jgi:hypothetical protein
MFMSLPDTTVSASINVMTVIMVVRKLATIRGTVLPFLEWNRENTIL